MKRGSSIVKSILLPIAVFVAVMAFVVLAAADASRGADAQQYSQTLSAIGRAITACYAIEGRYPPTIDYLKEHYGVAVDDSRYIVSYDIFASNVRPTVELIIRGSGGDASGE